MRLASIVVNFVRLARFHRSAGTTTLSTSPTARAADTSMLNKMRAVLSSHQCVSQQEAVSACMKAAKAQPSAVPVASPCSNYIDQLRYCELVTVQHNYPAVGTSFLF